MSSSCTACAWPRNRSKIKISRAANAHASADAKDAGLIFFRATRRPFRASSAHSYTAPYVPWPTCAILVNDARSRGPSSIRSASPACVLSQAGHARASRGVSHAEADLDFFSPPRFATETRTRVRLHFSESSNFVQTPSRTGAPRAAATKTSRESDSRRSRRTARPAFGSTEEPTAVAFAREDGAGSPASSRPSGGGSRGAEAHAPMKGRARVGQGTTRNAPRRFNGSWKVRGCGRGRARVTLVRRRVRPSRSPSAPDEVRTRVATPSRPRRSARGRVCRAQRLPWKVPTCRHKKYPFYTSIDSFFVDRP